MPRPKRTKVALSASARVAKASEDIVPPTQPSISSRSSQMKDEVKDIQTSTHRDPVASKTRGRPRAALKKVQPDAAQSRIMAGLRRKMDAATKKPDVSVQSRSHPAVSKVTATAGAMLASQRGERRSTSSSAPKSSSPGMINKHFEMQVQPRRPRTLTPGESDDLYDVSPSGKIVHEKTLNTGAKRRSTQSHIPQSSLKEQGTPAVETSVLALQKFKRRPRQPSILRMMQQRSDMLDDDLDDFNPEDESTPLNLRKLDGLGSSRLSLEGEDAQVPQTSSSRKRTRHPMDESEVQVLRSSPPVASETIIGPSSDLSFASPSLPEIVANMQENPRVHTLSPEQEIWSQTMAPPKSSSSLCREGEMEENIADRSKPIKRTRRNASPPVKSTKDIRPSRNRTRETELSTAALQALLPQRKRHTRQTRADQFDIPSSDSMTDPATVASDEDELQTTHLRKVVKKRTAKKKGPALAQSHNLPPSISKNESSLVKAAVRTYSRRNSDKENFVDESDEYDTTEEDSIETTDQRKIKNGFKRLIASKELQEAARKFQEIDEWEMEFESVDLGVNGSSPWR